MGQPLAPIVRLRTFSPNDWEDFTLEWATSLSSQYHTVERCGGAGDMGRDVIAFMADPKTNPNWDNYQCKHYKNALTPGDVWVELAKALLLHI